MQFSCSKKTFFPKTASGQLEWVDGQIDHRYFEKSLMALSLQ